MMHDVRGVKRREEGRGEEEGEEGCQEFVPVTPHPLLTAPPASLRHMQEKSVTRKTALQETELCFFLSVCFFFFFLIIIYFKV